MGRQNSNRGAATTCQRDREKENNGNGNILLVKKKLAKPALPKIIDCANGKEHG